MQWEKGYSATYYMAVVDPVTWRDVGIIDITGGTIKRTITGLLQSADVNCVDYPRKIEQWVRIYLDARQDDAGTHTALFTGLAISPDETVSSSRSESTVQCYSVLKPADDVALLRGWYALAGSNGAAVVKDLLSVCPAPVTVADNSPSLSSSIVAENGETRMTMIERVLKAINWHLRIDGDGGINIEPYDFSEKAKFDPIDFDVIENGIKIENDWFSIPNVFVAINDDLTGIARDELETSPLSTVSRGREIWMVETDCDFAANEGIAQYSARRLKEEQRRGKEVSYDRRYVEGVLPSNVIRMHYPAQGLDGLYLVESQSISLGYGARTSEKVVEI